MVLVSVWGISVFQTINIKAAKETIVIAYNIKQKTFLNTS